MNIFERLDNIPDKHHDGQLQEDFREIMAGPLPIGMTTYSGTSKEICSHKNGWQVNFRIWFLKRKAFVCSDCGNVEYL